MRLDDKKESRRSGEKEERQKIKQAKRKLIEAELKRISAFSSPKIPHLLSLRPFDKTIFSSSLVFFSISLLYDPISY